MKELRNFIAENYLYLALLVLGVALIVMGVAGR